MALRPPSVTQAAPSGPTMTPCGAELSPSGICFATPVLGSRRPSAPTPCAVYQTVPSGAGATSCGPAPAGTGKYCTLSALDGDAATAKQASMIHSEAAFMGNLRQPMGAHH